MVKPISHGSGAWKFAEKLSESKRAKCCVCKKKYTTSGNTSNVWKHLVSHGITLNNYQNAEVGEDGKVTFRTQKTGETDLDPGEEPDDEDCIMSEVSSDDSCKDIVSLSCSYPR